MDIFEIIYKKKPKYTEKYLKKKNGGYRVIFIPDEFTMRVQNYILDNFKKMNFSFNHCVMAFVENKSILDNANAHLRNNYLIHYDFRDFFDNIHADKIQNCLLKKGIQRSFLKIIKKWCFVKGHLPQGAPTSPFLANLACENLDFRFTQLAKKIGAVYTRYADDVIISGDDNIVKYQTLYKRIIRTEKFFINYKKVRITVLTSEEAKGKYPKLKWFVPHHVVTGICVDKDKVFIKKKYVNAVWKELKNYVKYGSGNKYSILGKIGFINFIDPSTGKNFYKYLEKINSL